MVCTLTADSAWEDVYQIAHTANLKGIFQIEGLRDIPQLVNALRAALGMLPLAPRPTTPLATLTLSCISEPPAL